MGEGGVEGGRRAGRGGRRAAGRVSLPMHPIAKASLISASCAVAGDAACQRLTRRRGPHDWRRSMRFAAVGATMHGPFFYTGFRWLDRTWPGKTGAKREGGGKGGGRGRRAAPPPDTPPSFLPASAVVAKTLAGQAALFPTYTLAAMVALAALDGADKKEVTARVRAGYGRALAAGTLYWPAVNAVNFALVPPSGHARLLAVNGAAAAWNAYLSLVTDDAARVSAPR